MVEKVEIPKAKKCDYCDEYAEYKVKDNGIYGYLCNYCYKNLDKVKQEL